MLSLSSMSKRSSMISNLGQTATETHKILKTVNENNKHKSAAIKCIKSRHSCKSLSIGGQRLWNDHKIGGGSTAH